MASETAQRHARSEARDYYAVLGAEPSASRAELRAAFRDAVLRYHPDRSSSDALATRRTSLLNRAWAELRDPVRRIHYDRRLDAGTASTLEWPLDEGEAPRHSAGRRRIIPEQPSRWHQPQWRNVAGFRVPAEVWLAGPAASDRYIVEHYVVGEDWRQHSELYWLRYAARWYQERGRYDDWVGALERLVELDPSFDTLVRAELRVAYVAAGEFLRGAAFLHRVGARYQAGSAARRWVDRELRAVLGPFRDRLVRRGPVAERAEHAELLLNYLEALELRPSFADVRAAIAAHRRAGHDGRAAELVERLIEAPVDEPARWFTLVQVLTEAGQLDRASRLLAEIARGDHPEALDARRLRADPARRIAAARRRLNAAQERIRGRSPEPPRPRAKRAM
jgi:tetratricopeptide (TPR) repeat protein